MRHDDRTWLDFTPDLRRLRGRERRALHEVPEVLLPLLRRRTRARVLAHQASALSGARRARGGRLPRAGKGGSVRTFEDWLLAVVGGLLGLSVLWLVAVEVLILGPAGPLGVP